MATTVVIPLDALNNIPGISGVAEVNFTVLDFDDAVDATVDAIANSDVVENAVEFALDQFFLGDFPFDDFQDLIQDDIREPIILGVEFAIDDAIPDIAQAVAEETIDPGDISLDPGDIQLDPGEIADDILDQIDDFDVQQGGISFESVFGATQQSITQGFELALEDQLGPLDDLPDALEDLGDLLADLEALFDPTVDSDLELPLESALDGLPGGTLLTDPDTFIDAQIDRVTNGLVDDDVFDETQQAIDEVL
jgi:hypothetical protein